MADVSLGLSISDCHFTIANVCGPLCKIIHLLKITMKIINVGPKIGIKITDKSDIYNSRPTYTRSDCPIYKPQVLCRNYSALSQLLKGQGNYVNLVLERSKKNELAYLPTNRWGIFDSHWVIIETDLTYIIWPDFYSCVWRHHPSFFHLIIKAFIQLSHICKEVTKKNVWLKRHAIYPIALILRMTLVRVKAAFRKVPPLTITEEVKKKNPKH